MPGRLQRLLADAIALERAHMGNVQAFDPADASLRIVAQIGFNPDFLEHFSVVRVADASACGRAAAGHVPVVIADVNSEIGFESHRAVATSAGFRSVKSTPIFDAAGGLLGMISTHCQQPRARRNLDPLENLQPGLVSALADLQAAQQADPFVRLLVGAILADGANKGLMQAFDGGTRCLHVIAQQGFSPAFLRQFAAVRPFDPSACGRAAGIGGTVNVADVTLEASMAPFRSLCLREGFRSVMAMPIIRGREGLLGVISVHRHEPRFVAKPELLGPILEDAAEQLTVLRSARSA